MSNLYNVVKAILVNGPKAGQWVDVPYGTESGDLIRMPEAPQFIWIAEDEEPLAPKYDEYRIFCEEVSMFGTKLVLCFGIQGDPMDVAPDILKALYRRDVFRNGIQVF